VKKMLLSDLTSWCQQSLLYSSLAKIIKRNLVRGTNEVINGEGSML